MKKFKTQAVGIDDMAFYTPNLYLDLKDLAAARDIPYEKLAQGLGTVQMAFTDVHEDAATMAAEAIAQLIERNNLNINEIGRIYLGTESALDASKPTITYAVEMLEKRFDADFRHCDVIDMTFACIGGTDALVHMLDWVSGDEERVGIVVASDFAKYELESTGEYTQGAGAVAMLVKWNPRLMVIRQLYGVSCKSVHDFYKPRREKYAETPVFDGQFSNDCYKDRMNEAMAHFRTQAVSRGLFGEEKFKALSKRWARMIFHLPYSFHGKRIFVDTFVAELQAEGVYDDFLAKNKISVPKSEDFESKKDFSKAQMIFSKKISETPTYQKLVNDKLEKAQRASSYVGNIYAASIWLGLMSTLESDLQSNADIEKKLFGFVAYGSGSKAKVFEGIIQSDWKKVVDCFGVFSFITNRKQISYEEYLALHERKQTTSIALQKGRFALQSIGNEGVTLGARYYGVA
jgi:hydroxymethylglutaryl-CoA synthase